jgi:hypothetical protein
VSVIGTLSVGSGVTFATLSPTTGIFGSNTIYIGGNVNIISTTDVNADNPYNPLGAMVVDGGVYYVQKSTFLAGNLIVSGTDTNATFFSPVYIKNATNSTTVGTRAFQVLGGTENLIVLGKLKVKM